MPKAIRPKKIMRVDALAVRLRPRSNAEAADLGVRLCQQAARSVFTCYLVVALPVFALCLATYQIAPWLPMFAIFMAKPWLDRTILFALARAAFGQTTTPLDVQNAQRQVWGAQFIRSWTLRRLSPWRSLTAPVYQLEGLRGSELRRRVLQVRSAKTSAGLLVTRAFSLVELVLLLALLALVGWFAPEGMKPDLTQVFDQQRHGYWQFVIAVTYAVVVVLVEPFYVAAGFGLYLNRRVELEAWDIEQEFRRAQPE
jgi:hypothetical protein